MLELVEMIRIEATDNAVEYILVADIVSLEVCGASDAIGPTIIRTLDGKELKIKASAQYIAEQVGWVVQDLSPKKVPENPVEL